MLSGKMIVFTLLVLAAAGIDAKAINRKPKAAKPVEKHLLCDKEEIPEGVTQEGRAERSEGCCGKDSGRVLHIQRGQGQHRDTDIVACLPSTTCPPGEIAILSQNESHVFMTCTPCAPSNYQPTASKSEEQRDPVCPEVHSKCAAEYGLDEITAGNSTHDSLCRCLWEEGFAPKLHREPCTNPEGFSGNPICSCIKTSCLENGSMVLNNEFKCVPKPLSTEESVTSTEEVQGTATLGVTTPKFTSDGEYVDNDRNWTAPEVLLLVVVVILLLSSAVFLMYKFHPSTRGCRNI